MESESPKLFIEINFSEYVFTVGKRFEENKFNLLYTNSVPNHGISENRITDIELVLNTIKENIFVIEQKINFTFKEVIIIIDNFDCSVINFLGYQKLNGSQLSKENITYIINSLKTKIIETEKKSRIIHIFNSSFHLDQKQIDNLPIGLFGDFYSHELSFLLGNENDFKNLEHVFNSCKLKIKKIISKSFADGVNLMSDNLNLNTFLIVKIQNLFSQITFFESSSLKFLQSFNYGSNLIIKDISKVTGLKEEEVKKILQSHEFFDKHQENDLVEKKYFSNQNFRKIRKKLIYDVAIARIQEFSELMVTKNVNFSYFLKKKIPILLKINDFTPNKFLESYKRFFSNDNFLKVDIIKNFKQDNYFFKINKFVHYGWKKEALPYVQEKKSLFTRFFDLIFK